MRKLADTPRGVPPKRRDCLREIIVGDDAQMLARNSTSWLSSRDVNEGINSATNLFRIALLRLRTTLSVNSAKCLICKLRENNLRAAKRTLSTVADSGSRVQALHRKLVYPVGGQGHPVRRSLPTWRPLLRNRTSYVLRFLVPSAARHVV